MKNLAILLFQSVFIIGLSFGQSEDNYAPDHVILELAKAYPLEKTIEKAELELTEFLNNPDPLTLADWENLGPNTMDTLSGRVVTIAIDPGDSERIYIGSGSGGLWRSINGGNSWTPITDGLPSPHVSAIAINPNNSDEILIGTGIGQVPTSTLAVGIGVLRSTDGGNSWETTGFSFPQSAQVSVYELVWDIDVPDKVYLGATNGLYVSDDDGQTWDVLIPNVRIYDLEIHPSNSNILYVAVLGEGIRRSLNGGTTWENVNNGIPFGNSIGRCGITICQSNPQIMYASLITSSGFGLLGVYKSIDEGESWSQLSNVPNFPCQPTNPANCTGWLFHDISVAPDDPDVVLIGSVQYWVSQNGGQSWTWRDYASNGSSGGNVGLTYVDTWKFLFHPTNPGEVFSCNDGGIQKSMDYGLNWERLNQDLVIGQTYSVATRNNDPDFMIGGFHDHGLQRLIASNNNTTWTRWSLGDGIQTLIDHTNENILYGNLQNGTPYKSVSTGSSHLNTFPITNGIVEQGPWITPLEMHPIESNILYTSSNNNLYRTTNGGSSWQSVLNVNTIRSLAINKLRPDTVYAHAFNSTSWSLWRSYDKGATWDEVDATNIPSWGVANLETSPHDPNTLYAVRNSTNSNLDHIKVSYDNGESWEDITNDLPDIVVRDILVSPLNPNHIYLATELGVYISENAGENWQPWNFNLPIVEVYDIDFSPSDQSIRIATMGRGVWKTQALPVNIGELNSLSGLDLMVYPNPARDAFYVDFNYDQQEDVQFRILNDLGQVIFSIEHALSPGTQHIEFDVHELNLTGNIYYLRVEIGTKALHKKILLH